MTNQVEPVDITAAMDALSLEQALLDTELANVRVIDLTRRLQEANAEVHRLRTQLDDLERGELSVIRVERDQLAAYKARVTGSLVYKLAQRVRTVPIVRKVLGV